MLLPPQATVSSTKVFQSIEETCGLHFFMSPFIFNFLLSGFSPKTLLKFLF